MFLGIEIGGTKLQLGVGNARGQLRTLVRATVARKLGRPGILRQIERLAPPLLERYPVRGIGVGFGGPVDVGRGRVVASHQIAGWNGFALRAWFERRFVLPTAVENDSNCAALAEAVRGAGRGNRAVVYTNIGTGIGGGFVLNRELYRGRFGAMEIGHTQLWIGDRWRTVELVASGLAIERGVTTVPRAARLVGVALANVVTLLNPEVVVVGGGVARAGARFFRPLRATVRQLVFAPFRRNCRIVPAALGETVVVVGAVLIAARARRGSHR